MKYLRKFATKADMADLEQPNVVLIGDTSEVLYNAVPNGVYIQHIDGKLYATDAWVAKGFANDEANGVAVVASECRFVIGKAELGYLSWSSDDTNLIEGCALITNSSLVKYDYLGYANTLAIIKTATSGAAYQCANYAFPNGANGYLPASGEWYVAWQNKEEVNNAMTIINAEAIVEDYHWSSSQSMENRAWRVTWKTGGSVSITKGTKVNVRPFTTL